MLNVVFSFQKYPVLDEPACLQLYPLSINIHVSECLSNFNSRRCDEIMVTQENMHLHSLISYIHVASLKSQQR